MPIYRTLPMLGLMAAAIAAVQPQAAVAQTAKARTVCINCWISAISADGKYATGQMGGNYETFYWKRGFPAKLLGRSDGVGGWPGISADGLTVGSSMISDDGMRTSGLWKDGVWTQITPPLPEDAGAGDGEDSSVWALSGDGKVVAGLYWRYGHTGGSAHGFRWSAETNMVGLPTAGGSARINAVSKDGNVLAGWQEADWGGWVATAWVDGQYTTLGDAQGWGLANGVSANGKFIVGEDYDADIGLSTAAKWTWNGSSWDKTKLGYLKPMVDGEAGAMATSANGKIVVGWSKPHWGPGGQIGFVWTQKHGKMKYAKDFFAQYGYSDAEYDMPFVMAVTPDGKSFGVIEQLKVSPWTRRSRVITLSAAVE